MAPRTPRWLTTTDDAGAVWHEALDLALADGVVTGKERRFLRHLHDLICEVRAWNQARIELRYALDHGIREPQTAWHARMRRELADLAEREREALERLAQKGVA